MKKIVVLGKDEHGYISTRKTAKSKYWGVTTRPNGSGHDCWIVSTTDPRNGKTVSLGAPAFNLKEVDAARVAACVYDMREGTLKNRGCHLIRSACGRYALFINHLLNTIERTYITDNMEFVNAPKQVAVVEPVAQVEPKLVAPSGFELLTRLIDLVTLTDDEALVLINKLSAKG